MDDSMAPVGIICRPDHAVMADVADRLRARDVAVRFLDPEEEVPPATVEGLRALVSKKARPTAFRALYHADRVGVPTWSGFLANVVCACRLVAISALEAVGCRVPPVHFAPPSVPHVAKGRFSWRGDVSLDGEGDFYQELVETDPVDYKYYCVHDGRAWRTAVLTVRSKLYGEKELLGRATPSPRLVARVTDLAERLDASAIGVDFVESDGRFYAVDVNAAPSFRGCRLEPAIADSIASLVETE